MNCKKGMKKIRVCVILCGNEFFTLPKGGWFVLMTLPENVALAADALLGALRDTEAFQEYERLRKAVLADEVNQRLLERFTRAQTALQMAAVAGSEPKEEDAAEFEKLSALLYQSPDVTDYLLAQMRVQQLTASAMDRIMSAAGINIDIKGV